MDNQYMLRAIELAKRGEGYTSPNPLVGAIIVKDNRILAEGFHEKYGELHAERNAILNLREDAHGATIYVTLEPCCHHGKQPPCTEAILECGISRVVIGSRDPNPLVAGKGVSFLREHGIEVIEDVLREECDRLNPIFFHYITTGKPYITLKYAMTMDGKIATTDGESQWITDVTARNIVHSMRHKYRGILVGINTVLADDPMLNCRLSEKRSPVRIICDSGLRLPTDSRIARTAGEYQTIVACCNPDQAKMTELQNMGIQIITTSSCEGHVNMEELFNELGKMKIDSILVEGGGEINDSLIRHNLVNQVEVFIGPKIFGGATAKTPVTGIGIPSIADSCDFILDEVHRLDQDVQLTYRRKICSQE